MIQLLVMEECSSESLSAFLRAFKNLLNIIHIIGPIILICGLLLHLINLMRNPDDKKLFKKLINSALAAVILFFVPTIVNALMYMMGESISISSCWMNISDNNNFPSYISPSDAKKNKKSPIIVNPDDYEKGTPQATNNVENTEGQKIDGTAKQAGNIVWDPNDVTKISNLTSTQLIGILNANGGNAKNFVPYASSLITAEQKYHVNVFFLIGIEAIESGWITSKIARNCNNLGGVCASSNHPSNGCGSNSNCSFAYFSSVNQFIDYHAKMLHEDYLTPGGSFYNGTSPSAVVTKYCPGCSSWPGKVTSIANSLFNEVSKVI